MAWWLTEPPVDGTASLSAYVNTAVHYVTDRRVFGLLLVEFSTFVLLFGAFLTYVPELLDARMDAASVTSGLAVALLRE